MVQMDIYSLEEISMNFKKYELKLDDNEKNKIIKKIYENYSKPSSDKVSLLWNKFVSSPRCIPFEKIAELNFPSQNLFFYLEREDEVFIANLEDIIAFVNDFEPWEEIDAYIFDEKMEWIVAITHEDNLLLCLGI